MKMAILEASMAFKLKTSKKTEEIFDRIEASENMPWYTLARLAIALSIRQGAVQNIDLETDNLGRELNRQTITGDTDIVYKTLIQLQENRHLTEDEFFPTYTKAHLDRGAILLDQEQRYGDDLLIQLTELEKSI